MTDLFRFVKFVSIISKQITSATWTLPVFACPQEMVCSQSLLPSVQQVTAGGGDLRGGSCVW